ncbi:putative xylanase/chitin deacetylase [Schinkia azotoformans MEV2011]|uniref:Putative xylanase/chitin deacetylase n=1 Tax=Schinkia azotoformans MEV2011 TaxID=1348973 RepID=A0A072NHC3_SCHAZ|nr:polysaccharide deacetylase family protein [Schinkia azotoformans]KEF36607.1 putative xylanase/chitin deacetylase [Schinkia azotoformans MEV2011]MEC1695572.1 polysaccharide deacetylase family protein [Schinkia azotoformans]MEC1723967.1 polysaccharide deacetylase family protein [Schinkia azotoformans]MEC1740781.1 polysaccharide deacetylase family protein [Schinkia azotoformans]MEC1743901.1 polysaccharide deacetylase family protein [Schinkia azotoformans]
MFSFSNSARNIIIMVLLLLSFLLVSTNTKAATTESLIFVAVNDELVEFSDAKPFNFEGVTYVPLRSLATTVKAVVLYDPIENSVTVTKDSQSMKILIKENMYVTESLEKLPISIKTVNDRTLLPLRFIAEYLQLEVTFYAEGPIARLLDHNEVFQLTNEQLYLNNKETIEAEKEKWKATIEAQKLKEVDSAKIAYLTFDDGPNSNTAQILDILQKYEAKATLFMVEPKIWKFEEVVKRTVTENHTIASHSVTHDKNKVYHSPESLLNEMNVTRATLFSVTGIDSRLIRVPYGSKPYLTKDYRDLLASNNLQVWDWNVDSNDWKYSTEKIISTVKYQVANQKQKNRAPVILFHNSSSTVEALPEIIEFLKAEGYVLEAYDQDHHFMVNFWNDERI